MALRLAGGTVSSPFIALRADFIAALDMFLRSDNGRPPINGPINSATDSFHFEGCKRYMDGVKQ